ncbi:MAG: N-formylglutamate amidohydrolase [Rhizobiaceae bacterium]|nr:N-formylglutamate amidohydrolase [Rhizobiaceae bacterium]
MADKAKSDVVSVLSGDRAAEILLICEHASNHIPPEFNNLGLNADALNSHVAWDPGAANVTNLLAKRFNAPAVLSGISRLVYDCNRPPSAKDAMPEKSEVYQIPGNKNLTELQKKQRIESYYQPFEDAIAGVLTQHKVPPILVTIHSFTPTYHGKTREVEIGILHDDDSLIADAMLDYAERNEDLCVLRNEPYGAEDGVTHTLKHHGIRNGLANVMIEIRNDLLQTQQQCLDISLKIAEMLDHALKVYAASPGDKERAV